ncbi:MAG: hypothetical protein ACLR9W_07495 [Enterobacter hormaechei]
MSKLDIAEKRLPRMEYLCASAGHRCACRPFRPSTARRVVMRLLIKELDINNNWAIDEELKLKGVDRRMDHLVTARMVLVNTTLYAILALAC